LPESSNDDNNYNYSTPNGKSSADAHRAASAEISRQKLLDDELQAKELQQEQQQRRNNNTNTNSNSNNTNTNSGSKTNPKSGNKQKDNPIIPDAVDFGTLMGDIAREREQSQSDGRIQLGICAMDKKARSKPMAEILSRLDETLFRVVFFGDDLILNRPIQEWPANIDVLVAFYSKGYPLQKAKEYVKLRDPYCLNDLDMQERLQDRRMVYDLLEASGIDVPRHVFLSQDGYKSTATGDGNNQGETTVKEFDDHIEVNGVCIHKPFVEKPVDADDHNIAIYYPTSAGGGCKKLFRKIGNRSSEFYPDIHEIRRDGSYVYEEFVETQGTDVKMYTVGPDYGHAEARKSPTVDGKVQRNADGKELRFPVILTLSEKEIARRIVLQFKQFVCGFDLLRVQEGHSIVSYCCDVNGFSFVKNSRKYYDDCAQILTEHMLALVKPEQHSQFSTLEPLVTEVNDAWPVVRGFMNPLQRVAQLLNNNNNNNNNSNNTASNAATNTYTNNNTSIVALNDGLTNHQSNHSNDARTIVSDSENIETRSHKSMLSTEEFPTLLEEGAVPVRQIPRELISEPASLPVSRDPSINDLLHLEGDSDDDNEDSHHLDGAFSGHKRDRCGDGNNYNDTGGDGIHGHRSSQTSNTDSNTDSNGHGINSNSVRSTEGLGLTDCPSRNSLVHQEELRCVIAVVRHADRTPKEKIKLNTNEPIILKYFTDHSTGSSQDNKTCQDNSNKQQQQQPTKDLKDLKIKAKGHMTEFLTAVRKIIASYEEKKDLGKNDEKIMWKFKHMRDVLVRWKFSGLNRKLQLKPKKIATDDVTGVKTVKEVQLILKWGGDLTKLGENQAIKLGQQFRHSIYPDSPGGGVLRLHSTFRHDLKIKTSDEGRVMKTAAAFAKGLLDLEGDIPPILVSLVHKEKGSMHMLDPSGDKDVKLELDECKEKISQHLQEDIDWRDMTEEDRIRLVGPPMVTSLRDALAKIGNPRKALQTIYETMATLIEELEEMWSNLESGDEKTTEESDNEKKESEDADAQLSGVKLYKGETLLELTERWRFIYQRMYDDETKMFDLSRIPDVLDNVRFDVLHNPHLGLTSVLHKLYSLAKDMADTVVPQEYGTTLAEKRSVGIKVCSPLLEKIRDDLQIARTDNKTDMRYLINMDYSADLPITTMGRRIRTRLYFTSESHLHTLINVLRFAGDNCSSGSTSNGSSPVLSPYGMEFLNESKEVCYLTQVVIRLFEDTGRRMSHPRRYRVEILFSAGATGTPIHQCKSTKEADSTRLDTDHLVAVGREGLTCQEVEEFFDSIIAERGQTDTSHDLRLSMKPSDLLLGSPKAPLSNSNNNNTATTSSKPTTPKAANANKSSLATPSAKSETSVGSTSVAFSESSSDGGARPGTITEGQTIVGGNEAIDKQQEDNTATKNTSRSPPRSTEKRMRSNAINNIEKNHATDKNNKGGRNDKTNQPPSSSNIAASSSISTSIGSNDGNAKNDRSGCDDDDDRDPEKAARDHQYFYLTIATTALALGVGCLVLATGLTGKSRNRRWR